MKDSVSLDLFPAVVCLGPGYDLYCRRFNFLFHLCNRWNYFSYFLSSSCESYCESYNSQLADLLENDLSGLGGVW